MDKVKNIKNKTEELARELARLHKRLDEMERELARLIDAQLHG